MLTTSYLEVFPDGPARQLLTYSSAIKSMDTADPVVEYVVPHTSSYGVCRDAGARFARFPRCCDFP